MFNTQSLMCKIFQYLKFHELIECDFVCTHWFYHSWNPNSLFYLNVCYRACRTLKLQKNGIDCRFWQRLVKVASIYWSNLTILDTNSLSLIANKLSMLKNIQCVRFYGIVTQSKT